MTLEKINNINDEDINNIDNILYKLNNSKSSSISSFITLILPSNYCF